MHDMFHLNKNYSETHFYYMVHPVSRIFQHTFNDYHDLVHLAPDFFFSNPNLLLVKNLNTMLNTLKYSVNIRGEPF